MKRSAWMMAAAVIGLMATTGAVGGPGTAGNLLVSEFDAQMQALETSAEAEIGLLAAGAGVQLGLQDKQGASEARLVALADRYAGRVARAEARMINAANRGCRRVMARLIGLDEDTLIDQVTSVDGDRDAAVAQVEGFAQSAQTAIADALAAAINN